MKKKTFVAVFGVFGADFAKHEKKTPKSPTFFVNSRKYFQFVYVTY